MIKLAFIGTSYAAQLFENPKGLAGVDVVFCGASLDRLVTRSCDLHPQVVVCSLDDLGAEPQARAARLIVETGAELVLVAYAYARRAVLNGFADARVRLIQGPLTLSNLRCQMLGVGAGT
jgi:hypothetical protein